DSAIVDPDGVISYPAMTSELDYEIELVAVVGAPLDDAEHATSCLMGYTIGNDVSARDAGRALGRLDLFTQKGMDATSPIGPWVCTLDEFGGGGQPELDMQLLVNGELRQQDNTREMIFPLDELLNYLDARIALRPGDVVLTGSTHGVGLETGRFLQPDDLVEASIDGIGLMRNRVGHRRKLTSSRRAGRLGFPTPSRGDVAGVCYERKKRNMNQQTIWFPLTHPQFRWFWGAGAVVNLAIWMHTVGAASIMAGLTESAWMVSLIQTAMTLPVFLFGLPGGVIADLVSRKYWLLFTQALMLTAAAVLLVMSLMGALNVW